jgi:hypothetical protein
MKMKASCSFEILGSLSILQCRNIIVIFVIIIIVIIVVIIITTTTITITALGGFWFPSQLSSSLLCRLPFLSSL